MAANHQRHKARVKRARKTASPTGIRPPRAWGAMAAAAFGVVWFGWQFDSVVPGPSTLWPTHIDWLMRPDWAQHYLGSCFARLPPTHLLDNSLPKLLPGLHMTVGLLDANPWLSAVLKLLNPVLPVHFQLLGLWLCLGFVVQGYMGARVAALWGASERVQALSGALLTTAPILLHRVGHDSLCVHWVIVAMLWCLLRSAKTAGAPRYAFFWPSALMLFVAGLHPYLGGMLAPLYGVGLAQAVLRRRTRHQAGLAVATGGACSLAAYGLTQWAGFMGDGASAQGDLFGMYSANILSLIDPSGWSQTLKAWPQVPMQHEGFGFLGLGGLVLVLLGLGLSARRMPTGQNARGLWWAVMAVAALCLGYAIGPRMMFADVLVASWEPYAQPLLPYLSVFRASGRFIWVVHYALWVWALGMCLTRLPKAAQGPIIAGLLVAQLWDMTPDGVVLQRTRFAHTSPPLTDSIWQHLRGEYDHLEMVPPDFNMHEHACPMQRLPLGTWAAMAKVAYENGLSYNSAQVSRINEASISTYCADLQRALVTGRFDTRTVYAVSPLYLRFFEDPSGEMVCARANQWHVCTHRSRGTALRSALLKKTQTAAYP